MREDRYKVRAVGGEARSAPAIPSGRFEYQEVTSGGGARAGLLLVHLILPLTHTTPFEAEHRSCSRFAIEIRAPLRVFGVSCIPGHCFCTMSHRYRLPVWSLWPSLFTAITFLRCWCYIPIFIFSSKRAPFSSLFSPHTTKRVLSSVLPHVHAYIYLFSLPTTGVPLPSGKSKSATRSFSIEEF